jgi:hypothetical protein
MKIARTSLPNQVGCARTSKKNQKILILNIQRFFYYWENIISRQNYWGFGFCPSYGIIKTRKHSISETGPGFVLR